MQLEPAIILGQKKLCGNYRVLELGARKIAAKVQPGQFVHLRAPGADELVLRRPFSVFKAGRHSLSILYKIVGKGTAALAELRKGDRVGLIGPLGVGYPLPGRKDYPVLVAGGYGSAALYLLAQRAASKGTVFIGGASKSDILCPGEFRKLGWQVKVATEDGSMGQKGLVTDALKRWLGISEEVGRGLRPSHLKTPAEPSERVAHPAPFAQKLRRAREGSPYRSEAKIVLYACGPMGMLKAVAGIAMRGGWRAWLALDRHMGCGLGACLACVQKVKDGSGGWKWARICTEGPVFECREIIWD